MKAVRKNFFSMVEVALAVAILAAGATTVITLVPVGIKQKKDAMGENYSAIFTSDAQSYFSSLAKSSFNSLTELPNYNGVFSSDPKQPQITYALKGTSIGSDLYETNVPGVYYISKSSGNIQDYAGEVIVWQSVPYSQDVNVVTPKPKVSDNKNITGGVVSNTAPVDISMNCLASEFGNGYHNYDIYFEIIITEPGKPSYSVYPFGKNTAAKSTSAPWTLPNVPAGTTIVAKATDAENPNWEPKKTVYLSTDLTHVKTLKNGDKVPTDTPFYESQASAGAIVAPYVSADGKTMKMGKDQVIYLFDMNTSGPYDFNDFVVMTNLPPTDKHDLKTLDAGIGISPANDTFDLVLNNANKTTIDTNMLKGQTALPSPYNMDDFYTDAGLTFDVNSLNMNIKGQATAIVDGTPFDLKNKSLTMNAASDGSMHVKIWNTGRGNGKANGQWYIAIPPSKVTIDNGTTTTLVPPAMVATTSTETIGVGVNIEISWPISQMDYSKRNKLRYYTEYYNMAEIGN